MKFTLEVELGEKTGDVLNLYIADCLEHTATQFRHGSELHTSGKAGALDGGTVGQWKIKETGKSLLGAMKAEADRRVEVIVKRMNKLAAASRPDEKEETNE